MPILTTYRREDFERHYAAGHWRAETLPAVLARHAARRPDRLALDDGVTRYTYRELRDAVDAFAARLAALGLDRESVLAIQLPNCAEFVVAALAAARVEAVMSPIPMGTGLREVAELLERCGAEGYVAPAAVRGAPGGDHARAVQAAAGCLRAVLVAGPDDPGPGLLPFRDPAGPPAPAATAALDARYRPSPDAVLDLMYTSGTTGRPKGILNTTNSKLAGLRGFLAETGLGADDVWAVLPPMAHNAGWLYSYLAAFLPGATAHLLRDWSPAAALRLLAERGCTAAFMVPTQARDLLDADPGGGRRPGRLRLVGIGAAETPAALKQGMRDTWGCTPVAMYGMTECQANLFTRPGDPWEAILETVGRACPGMEVAVFDPGRARRLPDGEVGEIATRGAGLFAGYHDDQRATSAAFNKDGWFFSGDLGSVRDGYVTLHGRAKDVIIRGGHNVVPEAVEAQLAGHPAVADVSVVGVPDERLGERACACVIPRGPAPDLEALVAYLRERGVGPLLWPEFLLVVEAFPRTPLGKVQRGRLRAEAIEALRSGRLAGRPAGEARR
jgi:acyl-CoA synthetase (AMP-forming)/AMP-acid ligase II